VDVGQYVGPGTPVGVTFAVDRAEIRLPLSGSDMDYLELPSATRLERAQRIPVKLSADSGGISGQWSGEIVRTEGVVDDASRVVYAVAEVVDPYGFLGQSTQAELKMAPSFGPRSRAAAWKTWSSCRAPCSSPTIPCWSPTATASSKSAR